MKNIKRDCRFKLILNNYDKEEQIDETIKELQILIRALERVKKANFKRNTNLFSLLDVCVDDMKNEMSRTYIMLAKLEKMFKLKQMNQTIGKMMEREIKAHPNKRNLF